MKVTSKEIAGMSFSLFQCEVCLSEFYTVNDLDNHHLEKHEVGLECRENGKRDVK